MKKFFLFFVAALFCANVNADKAVNINYGGNTTQGHFPVYGYNVSESGQKVQTIYLEDQLKGIEEGSEIKALTFYSANQTQSWGSAQFRVSLAPTTYTFFQNASGAWATSSTGSFTQVYNGPLSVAEGELTINFSTPYVYEGGNLLIQVEVSTAASYASASASSFYSASTSSYLIKFANSGSSRETKQPKVTLIIADGGDDPVSQDCKAPTAVTVESVADVTATISWEGEAEQYQYCLVEEGDLPDWTDANLTSQKSVTLSDLYDESKYYLYVRSYCSETEVSEAVKVTFKTACARLSVPWIETFTRDASGSETVGDVTPVCWIISSPNPEVTIVAEKQDDGQGNQIATGQQYLQARGGGPTSAQIFALPLFDAQLDTCELAFDYYTNVVSADYGSLEIGYMTKPTDASTFVSLHTFEQTTTSKHVVFPLDVLPAGIEYIAFRFAGGTSNYGRVSMDNFIMAGIGHSDEVDPSQEVLPDANIYAISYCQAQFLWYSYNASAFAIGLFNTDSENLVAGIVATTEECERFAYQDQQTGEFSGFSDSDDYNNHYYCSTKWILNADESGMQRGGAWETSVINVGTMLGLAPGHYQIQIYELVASTETASGYAQGELLATISFEIVAKYVTNLQAVVAEDHQTATLTWDAPELAQGERLYVRVWSGETVAYDNFNTNDRPTSPLTVNVVEGKTYTAVVQVIDRNKDPQGPEVSVDFTVGANPYIPQNLTATVTGGDNVTFSWTVEEEADRYVITLYHNGEFYSTLNVSGTTKTTTTPEDGEWSWTVQAFNQGSNGNYFEASNAVWGNDFDTHTADIPDDAIELHVSGFNAHYIQRGTNWYQEGKNGWVLEFGLDDAGYNLGWFLVYTADSLALSGVYNADRQNIDDETQLIYLSDNSYIQGKKSEIRLQFDGYDEVEVTSSYIVTQAFYTGSFRLEDEDGQVYVARFMELMCSSGDSNALYGNPSNHITLENEDPSYFDGGQGIEDIVITEKEGAQKLLHDGQLFIIRDGRIFNAQGTLVK